MLKRLKRYAARGAVAASFPLFTATAVAAPAYTPLYWFQTGGKLEEAGLGRHGL